MEEISDAGAPEQKFLDAGTDEGGARRGGAVTYYPKDSNQKTRSVETGGRAGRSLRSPARTPHNRTRSGRPVFVLHCPGQGVLGVWQGH